MANYKLHDLYNVRPFVHVQLIFDQTKAKFAHSRQHISIFKKQNIVTSLKMKMFEYNNKVTLSF